MHPICILAPPLVPHGTKHILPVEAYLTSRLHSNKSIFHKIYSSHPMPTPVDQKYKHKKIYSKHTNKFWLLQSLGLILPFFGPQMLLKTYIFNYMYKNSVFFHYMRKNVFMTIFLFLTHLMALFTVYSWKQAFSKIFVSVFFLSHCIYLPKIMFLWPKLWILEPF